MLRRGLLAGFFMFVAVGAVVSEEPCQTPGGDSPNAAAPDFSTAAEVFERGSAAVAFAVGDFGDGSAAECSVAAAMHAAAGQLSPAALITTGDNLYSDDVDVVWFGPYGWVQGSGMEVWVSWGNHDVETGRRRRLIEDVFEPPGRWYSQKLGDATVVVLDGNDPDSPEQLAWLESTLEANDPGLIIAAFHQPPFSCSRHGDSAVQNAFVPLFERYGVDLILNGHEHNYQRFDHNGTMYVITGGGGAALYDVAACPPGTDEPVASAAVHHFLALSVTGDTIEVRVFTPGGEKIDGFTVTDE